MAKEKRVYVCESCGAESGSWRGQCSECQGWNTLKEFRVAGGHAPSVARGGLPVSRPIPLAQVEGREEPRLSLGMGELDRVLGGGLVKGSVVLLGGDPGIGKSTLLLQALAMVPGPVLYVSGEESLTQIKLRADRLGIVGETLMVLAETRVAAITSAMMEGSPTVVVVDSIQTVAAEEVDSAPGTINQIRSSAAHIIRMAKEANIPVFLVGHVTKEGLIAGPRVLEHMVDTVLYFEGERGHQYRILRAVKNRFGPANEIGVFAMGEGGLAEVANPSALFLSERVPGAAGSVVYPGIEGTRPVLMEIQSLVVPSPLAQPRRTTLGLDGGRLAMLVAILERRTGVGMFDRDIFLNVAGGLRIAEPAADLPVLLALYCSMKNKPLDPETVVFGEVGLLGEVRGVAQVEVRLREAAKLGFTRAILPAGCVEGIHAPPSVTLVPVATVEEAVGL